MMKQLLVLAILASAAMSIVYVDAQSQYLIVSHYNDTVQVINGNQTIYTDTAWTGDADALQYAMDNIDHSYGEIRIDGTLMLYHTVNVNNPNLILSGGYIKVHTPDPGIKANGPFQFFTMKGTKMMRSLDDPVGNYLLETHSVTNVNLVDDTFFIYTNSNDPVSQRAVYIGGQTSNPQTYWLTMSNCMVSGSIKIENVADNQIQNSIFNGYLGEYAVNLIGAHETKFTNDYFKPPITSNSQYWTKGGVLVTGSNQVAFSNCEFDGSPVGSDVTGMGVWSESSEGLIITGSQFYGHSGVAIYIRNSPRFIISSDYFNTNNYADNYGQDIDIVGSGSKYGIVTDTTHVIVGGKTRKGFWVMEYNDGSGVPDYNKIRTLNGDGQNYAAGFVRLLGTHSSVIL